VQNTNVFVLNELNELLIYRYIEYIITADDSGDNINIEKLQENSYNSNINRI